MKKLIVIACTALAVSAASIGLGNIIMEGKPSSKLTFNGNPIGYRTVESFSNELDSLADIYSLSIKHNGLSGTINGNSIDLKLSLPDSLVNEINRQANIIWPLRELESIDIKGSYTVEYDEDKMVAELSKIDWLVDGQIEPTDARISDKLNSDGQYYIIEDKPGDIIELDIVIDEVNAAIGSLADTVELDDKIYKKANITADNKLLLESLEKLNKHTNINIVYTAHDKTFTFDREFIKDYIEIGDNGEVSVSEEAIEEFMNNMNSELTTMGLGLNFVTHSGETKQVPGGNWGWWLDYAKTKENLEKLISLGGEQQGEIFWRQECPNYGESEFTNYVEIDLGNQHLYLYKEGELVGDWPIVSGLASNADRKTPDGIYKLTYKDRKANLVGPGYSVDVEYWMPFNGGVGMHDASWRGSNFGGSIYKWNGSHGCVNMPMDGAKTVFETIDDTYAIICYY